MTRFTAMLTVLALIGSAFAEAQTVIITRAGTRNVRPGPAENFTGGVRVEMLFEALDPSHASGGTVSFEAGARTAWHSHPRGQILIVTAGTGRVQRWGDPMEEMRAGDVVRIPADEKHEAMDFVAAEDKRRTGTPPENRQTHEDGNACLLDTSCIASTRTGCGQRRAHARRSARDRGCGCADRGAWCAAARGRVEVFVQVITSSRIAQVHPYGAQRCSRRLQAGAVPITEKDEEMQIGLLMLGVCLLTATVPSGLAQAASQGDTKATVTQAEQDIVTLSKDKWRWMAERNVEALDKLFAPEAIFVHMGATMSKSQELEVIKSGTIQYKDAQIQEVSVRFVGGTAILLNRIRLVAVVGGNEVVNPFNVTEVYVKVDGVWRLGSVSFTRLLTPQ